MTLEIGKHLVLSTVHVRCATSEILDAWVLLAPEHRPLTIASTTYGWFMPTGQLEGPLPETIPAELGPILDLARQNDCSHVLFDCDGPKIGELPQFPW